MEKKFVFGLLILWGFVSQGFCTSSEENEESPDIHIRKKRLIGHVSTLREAHFLVSLITNGMNHCPATLLTDSVVITSAECFKVPSPRGWQIQAGTTRHQVENVISYGNYNSSSPTVNNLALAFFRPRINIITTNNRPIKIYSGNLATEYNYPVAYNWEHELTAGPRKQSSIHLQKVILQLVSYSFCRDYYHNKVGPGNICTQSSIQRHYCQPKDTGAPLVIQNELLGIYAFRGESYKTDPDVFMNLMDHDIRRWINEHVPALHLH